MFQEKSFLKLFVLSFLLTLLTVLSSSAVVTAAQLTLSWSDNSTNEDGFKIERGPATTGPFTQIGTVPPNAASYTDSGLAEATTFCYRVRAFNATGDSGYTNVVCATTTATLTVAKSGNGTVTSSPAGIDCGADCAESYASNGLVTLTATAAAGSTFTGWSGACTGTAACTVTMNGAKSVTATFALQTFALTTNTSGTGSGTITSSPAGINCGGDCSESYASGAAVTLTATAAAGSTFTGWSGACTGTAACTVTMNANKSCTANFAQTNAMLTVTKVGSGSVSSKPSGINCGSTCSYSFSMGWTVTLQATPSAGFTFAGWSGAGCQGTATAVCKMFISSNTAVTATFVNNQADKVGIYRPSTGEWFLDRNGDGCSSADGCVRSLTTAGAVPVVGEWNGTGVTLLGLFLPATAQATAQWSLYINGNEVLEYFGQGTDIPVSGKWSSRGYDRIGVFRPSDKRWYLDVNGNGSWNSCSKDRCASLSVYRDGDLPVTGDWNGRGVTKVGLYRPSTGEWFLDLNGDRSWTDCRRDLCISGFVPPDHTAKDLPVTGDWNGDGVTKVGLYRPSTGQWFLDLNGDGSWTDCIIDLCVTNILASAKLVVNVRDIPVVGKW